MGRTVIVGGGTAGLAAAFTLERAGAGCTVLEKRDFSGGRIYGIERDGFVLDLGAQFFFTRYPTTFDLMNRLGISGELTWCRQPMAIMKDGVTYVVHTQPRSILENPGDLVKFNRFLTTRGKVDALRFVLRLVSLGGKFDFHDPLKAVGLDCISMADYARENFGEEILEYLCQPVVGALTLGDPEEVSAAYAMALMWYFIPGLGWPKRGIGQLARSLSSNVSDMRLNAEASRIVVENGVVRGVEFTCGDDGGFMEADSVICATTGPEAARLLADLPRSVTDALGRVRYSASTHVMLATDRKVMGDVYVIATPRREGLCVAGIGDNSNKSPAYAPAGCSIVHAFTFSSHARRMLEQSDSVVVDRAVRDIKAIIPDFPDEILFHEVFRWPEAVCLSSPGHIKSMYLLGKALGEYRGLELAGEYLGMPSVEAALHSGVEAARRVLETS